MENPIIDNNYRLHYINNYIILSHDIEILISYFHM